MQRAETELRYISASLTPGVGGATLKALLTTYGSIGGIWDAFGASSATPAVTKVEMYWTAEGRNRAVEILDRTLRVPARVCVWEDPEFPAVLADVSNPPAVLYVRGDLSRLTSRALALVGTTDPSAEFARRAGQLARNCADYGIHVVSGLARGIDSTALRAAVEMEVPAFAVVGHGVDYEYPRSGHILYSALAQTGAVISQFPTGHGPQRWTFPLRNEVMCTLAYGTLIVQAHNKCGSRIQADFSFKHGRDVFIHRANETLPDNEWFHDLRGRGAHVFDTFEEVVEIVAQRHDQFRGLIEKRQKSPDQPQLNLTGSGSTAQPPRAVLFDVDGVVTDTQETTRGALVETLQSLGIRVGEGDERALSGSPWSIARQYGADWPRFRSHLDSVLQLALAKRDFVRADMREVLRSLRVQGWRLAAVTSQPRKRAMVMLKQDASLFDVIITYNDTPGKAKPNPYPLQLAASRLGVSEARSILVGDTHQDVLAARNARMRCIAVLWGYETEASLSRYSPDHIVSSPAELADVLQHQEGEAA